MRQQTLRLLPLLLVPLLACREPVPRAAYPTRLSGYNLFLDDLTTQAPAKGVWLYEINTPLFSDYAEKLRFVQLPAGHAARYQAERVFDFPVGTRIVKTFYYPEDFRQPGGSRRLVETRLLIRELGGWVGLPYVWNEAQTDASLQVAGARVAVSWIDLDGTHRSLEYRVPSVSDCGLCHRTEGKTLAPIGTKAAQLNRRTPQEGIHREGDASENQLVAWHRNGIVAALPPLHEIPRFAVWNDATTGSLDQRARAWLDVNCAHCHNPAGPASSAALDLRAEQREPHRFGVFKHPVAAGRGAGGRLYDIWPGRPEASILVHRLESLEPGVMMPELGRTVLDPEGTGLIRAWIASMDAVEAPDRR